ncbi:hypothetical protein AB6813_17185 [bacterium RCC_150]
MMSCRDSQREAIVDEVLADLGPDPDLDPDLGPSETPVVRRTLLSLGAFAGFSVPSPGPELAEMLAGSVAVPAETKNLPPDELAQRRQASKLHKHPLVLSAAIVAAMGLGVGGVAASSSGLSPGAPDVIQHLMAEWARGWSAATPSSAPAGPPEGSPKVAALPAPPRAGAGSLESLPAVPAGAGKPATREAPAAKQQSAVTAAAGGAGSATAASAATRSSSGLADPFKPGLTGNSVLPKVLQSEPKPASQPLLGQGTDVLPSSAGGGLQDGLKALLQGGTSGVASLTANSGEWLLGLPR